MTDPKYGADHRAIRRWLLPLAFGKPCPRCGRPMVRGQELDLDHADDGHGYNGMVHASCNRAAGAVKGNKQRAVDRRAREGVTRMDGEAPDIGVGAVPPSISYPAALAVEVSQDRRFTSVVAVELDPDGDGGAIVSLAHYLEGWPPDAVPFVVALVETLPSVVAVVIDPHSPAETLRRPLLEAGAPLTRKDFMKAPTAVDLGVAHGQFMDELAAGRVRFHRHPALTAAARAGDLRRLAGTVTWDRSGPVDIGPLVAATLAHWARLATPARPPLAVM